VKKHVRTQFKSKGNYDNTSNNQQLQVSFFIRNTLFGFSLGVSCM